MAEGPVAGDRPALLTLSEAALMVRPSAALVSEFRRVFGVPFRDFRDALGGFDPMAFDEWLGAGDRSVLTVAEERFGARAGELLLAMLRPPVRGGEDARA